jgi:FkbM family methyltransferase
MSSGATFESPSLPHELTEDRLSALLEMPPLFHRVGEARQHRLSLESLVETLHGLALSGLRDPRARGLAQRFVERANFCQAYFTDENLRELFRKRAAIIEAFLRAIGWELDQAPRRRSRLPARLKLGVLATTFGRHPESYLLTACLDDLDRERFDIRLYGLFERDDPVARRLKTLADSHTLLEPDEPSAAARRIRADDLDVLLIGSNVTAQVNRVTLLAAHRLARIQVALMASPVTTGLRNVDVMLSARFNEPETGAQEHYTERLHLLPGTQNCYPYEAGAEPPTVEITRGALAVPEDGVVYFSGSNCYKIIPELSAVWARILAAVPGSYLVLLPFNPYWSPSYPRRALAQRIEEQMEAAGVEANRLRIVAPVPTRADVQSLIRLADVYLDSYPFSGACSVVDPLVVGCPVVAWRGGTARSLHASSMLRAMDLDELVASSEEDYIARAVALGRDPAARARLRRRILDHPKPLPCLDTRSYSRKVGEALWELLAAHVEKSRAALQEETSVLKRQIETLAARLAGQSPAFATLTDARIVSALIHPFLRGQEPRDGPLHLVDVGACHGQHALPLLAEGWTADLLEPDPAAREVLERSVAAFADRCCVFPVAAGDATSPEMPFCQAAVQGLSSFVPSPFGATERVITVRSVRLGEFLAEQGTRRVDFLKIDAEGWDFKALEGHDFERLPPRLVLVEFGTQFPGQSAGEVDRAVARMKMRGYDAVVFAGADDGNFRRGVWEYRLAALRLGACIQALGSEPFGNVVFYRQEDKAFLVALLDLLESLR